MKTPLLARLHLFTAAALIAATWPTASRAATDIDISPYYTAGWADQNAPGLGNTERYNGPEIALAPRNGDTGTGIAFGNWDGHYVEVGPDISIASETLTFAGTALPTNPSVNALFNTFYGQTNQPSGTIVFTNDQGQTASFSLVGNQTIRDYNNNTFTNDLQGFNLNNANNTVATQNWWNNSADANGNGHQRLDVTTFILPTSWAGTALVGMTIINPATGATTNDVVLSALQVDTAKNYSPFFNGEVALSNGVYYLTFPATGNSFGYYSFLTDPHYFYHFDLGYEYTFDANDNHAGVYFYDFASSGFFYTSPAFPFPYLYDFSLNSVVYYYPDPSNAGRYNTNGVRYFYVFSTGQIISK